MARGIDTSTKGPSCHKKYAVCRVLGSLPFQFATLLEICTDYAHKSLLS